MAHSVEGVAGSTAPVASEAADMSTWKALLFVEDRAIRKIPIVSQ